MSTFFWNPNFNMSMNSDEIQCLRRVMSARQIIFVLNTSTKRQYFWNHDLRMLITVKELHYFWIAGSMRRIIFVTSNEISTILKSGFASCFKQLIPAYHQTFSVAISYVRTMLNLFLMRVVQFGQLTVIVRVFCCDNLRLLCFQMHLDTDVETLRHAHRRR